MSTAPKTASPATVPVARPRGPRIKKSARKNPQWFQTAVFYEVLTRGFYDSNDDGTGDLQGLTQKLDYLQWLGVDCLWMLPFYTSPLKDGGYDIADYYNVHPDYGTVEDARNLVNEAHSRGMRVIADLVLNHTSDQHAWFQESRQSRDNPKSDWYVWSDDDHKYADAPIIFTDFEKSNWTWDPVREQYYWHRFYSHQPDLNFENPEVQQAMLDVVRFWLDVGFDGFRLDAIALLFEEEGTTCANLPATHDYLRRLRAEIDANYTDRVLLAEVDQWPADLIPYFGDSDECHMCFHFPLMPRMFLSVRREQRYPITEILAATPELPENCQWGMFLRNHDEMTLQMVTDEERDYLYREYAKDPRMKRNVGISRRLFPLVDNDRAQAQLLHAMLFSMPGSPVLYYGDEISMGDNIFLGDRDANRTPMQWTPDRNGGFSKCDPAAMYLPPSYDTIYGYQRRNVESQQRDTASFLHWMKRVLEIRKQHAVFGTGSFETVPAENPSILAYIRQLDDDIILCVNNLSRFAQPFDLQMSKYEGRTPVEMLGRVPFPDITGDPYRLTLGPHQFFWLALKNVEVR